MKLDAVYPAPGFTIEYPHLDTRVFVRTVSTLRVHQEIQMTELMNWLLLAYSTEQLPEPFVPFSVAEVAALRPDLEANPEKTRMRILGRIAQDLPSLAVALEEENGR